MTSTAHNLLTLTITTLALIQGVTAVPEAPRITVQPLDAYVASGRPATLSCSAVGSPQPMVTWYRNGRRVVTSDVQAGTPRMLTEDGNLFFLYVRKSDVGIYHCSVSNSLGTVLSRNVSLQLAMLKEAFEEEPRSQVVAAGGPAVITCRPPRGLPPPQVTWLRNGSEYYWSQDNDVSQEADGALVFSVARRRHSASYVCVAQNAAGRRESRAASFSVLERAEFVERPVDTTVANGDEVILKCKVSGSPRPVLSWSKREGAIDKNRARQMTSGDLHISDARIADDGVYVCHARNQLGVEQASARLTVNVPPFFSVAPGNKRVGLGHDVSFLCRTVGNPRPAKFWQLADHKKENMYPGQVEERFLVSADATLIIRNVQQSDAGDYLCLAYNEAGDAVTKATLTVVDEEVGDQLDLEARHWISGQELSGEVEPVPLPAVEEAFVRSHLAGHVVELDLPQVVSAASIIVTWKLTSDAVQPFVQGFQVQYRARGADVTSEWRRHLVTSGVARKHVLHGLRPDQVYSIRVGAYYHGLESRPTRDQDVRTLEAVPSIQPLRVRAEVVGGEALRVYWEAPEPLLWNSRRDRGFRVYCVSRDEQYNVSVNASVTSVLLRDLRQEQEYSVRVAAVNAVGEGRSSSAGYQVTLAAADSQGVEPWLLGALIGGSGAAVWITLCALALCLCRRRRAAKSRDALGASYSPQQAVLKTSLTEGTHSAANLQFENSGDSSYIRDSLIRYCQLNRPEVHPGESYTKINEPVTSFSDQQRSMEIPAYASASLVSAEHEYRDYSGSQLYQSAAGDLSSHSPAPPPQPTPHSLAAQPLGGQWSQRNGQLPVTLTTVQPSAEARGLQYSHGPPDMPGVGRYSSLAAADRGQTSQLEKRSHSVSPFHLGQLIPPPPSHPPPAAPDEEHLADGVNLYAPVLQHEHVVSSAYFDRDRGSTAVCSSSQHDGSALTLPRGKASRYISDISPHKSGQPVNGCAPGHVIAPARMRPTSCACPELASPGASSLGGVQGSVNGWASDGSAHSGRNSLPVLEQDVEALPYMSRPVAPNEPERSVQRLPAMQHRQESYSSDSADEQKQQDRRPRRRRAYHSSAHRSRRNDGSGRSLRSHRSNTSEAKAARLCHQRSLQDQDRLRPLLPDCNKEAIE